MTRMTYFLGLSLTMGLAAASLPQIAAAADLSQRFSVEPGLYETSTTVFMAGQTVMADASEDCVREGENSKTLEELVEDIRREGNCTLSNISTTDSAGYADFVCRPAGLGFEATGTMEAEYGSDYLTVIGDGTMGFLGAIQIETKAKRIGECPAGPIFPNDPAPN